MATPRVVLNRDLDTQAHYRRNAIENIEFLLTQGETLPLILKRLGIKPDTYEKWMERR